MNNWSLRKLLAGLHDDIEHKLKTARGSFQHPGTKGDASEGVWLELLSLYLPRRYRAAKAHVVDSNGTFSQQIDVAIFDRQYSPFIFTFQEQLIIPAESVYAVFEAKQAANAAQVAYAQEKVSTVRQLHRTSLPIPTANGLALKKEPAHIMGGLLTFESDWTPGLGEPLTAALQNGDEDSKLDLGCVAAHGIFQRNADHSYSLIPERKPATGFLFELIARLQSVATVPMMDVRAYARWLEDDAEASLTAEAPKTSP
jgi:hypothetical protein